MATRVVPILYRASCDCGYQSALPQTKRETLLLAAAHRRRCLRKGMRLMHVTDPTTGRLSLVWHRHTAVGTWEPAP